jgi:hypothetical protein
MLHNTSTRKITGSDLFFLALEGASKRASRNGYVCKIALTLDGRLSAESLRTALSVRSLGGYLGSLKWDRSFPFTVPRWKTSSHAAPLSIREQETLAANWDVGSRRTPISAFDPPAFDIELLHTSENKTILIMSWHHGIMDARGGDLLLQMLGDGEQTDTALFPNTSPPSPGIVRLKRARNSITIISQQCEPPVARLVQRDQRKDHYGLSCRIVRFSEEETARVLSIAAESGSLFLSSLFFLAVTVRAFDQIMKSRGTVNLPYVIPVGQDSRKRGSRGPVFMNQVNFLFFRVEPELTESIPLLVSNLREQMEEQIRESGPEEFGVILNFFRHFPLWFVSHQIAAPSGGELASFYFSYQAGSELADQRFLGLRIADVAHIPPVAYPPGLSVAFYMYQQRLSLSFSFFEECLSIEEVCVFEDSVKTDLGVIRR